MKNKIRKDKKKESNAALPILKFNRIAEENSTMAEAKGLNLINPNSV